MPGFEDVSGRFHHALLDPDAEMRSAAFAEARRLVQGQGVVTSQMLSAGFQFRGERIPFVNPQRGIFKPRQMRRLLSIKTVYPRKGRRVWYDDQTAVHRQIWEGDETIDYSFMGDDPEAADNQWLGEAARNGTPIIYFLGTSPGVYQPIVPAFVVDVDSKALKARVAFSPLENSTAPPETSSERRYAVRAVKQRLHQATFRQMVITAYGGRCAISGLPEPLLLDAAHIVEDADERLGQPILRNGLPLSKIHHAAFDAHLIGIDADCVIHVSPKLLNLKDGPQLEALRQFHGKILLNPSREIDRPDRDRLALRFEKFKLAA